MKNSIDVIFTVHVEEHAKYIEDCHVGHDNFFRYLIDKQCRIPLTLLIERVKEKAGCPGCDRAIINELQSMGVMEIGLHVHPALGRFSHRKQKMIIEEEYKRFVDGTGIIPKSFSGGHWCINADSIRIIRKLNLCVDASMIPGCLALSTNGAAIKYPDRFLEPFWISDEGFDVEDKCGRLLEMPITINYNGRIMDVTTSFLWDILTTIHFKSLDSRESRDYIHMTFHSYDLVNPDGKPNYIYDKIMMICDRIRDSYADVRFMTCNNYYKSKSRRLSDEN